MGLLGMHENGLCPCAALLECWGRVQTSTRGDIGGVGGVVIFQELELLELKITDGNVAQLLFKLPRNTFT